MAALQWTSHIYILNLPTAAIYCSIKGPGYSSQTRGKSSNAKEIVTSEMCCRKSQGRNVPALAVSHLVPITVEVARNTPQHDSSYDDEKQTIETYRVDSLGAPPAYDSTESSTVNDEAPKVALAEQDQRQLLFTQLPITVRHVNNITIAQDIVNISQAIAGLRANRWRGKHKAKRARRHLLRDLWTMEEMRYGTCCKISWDEKKTIRREIKLVKKMTKEEIKRAWWGRDGLYVGTE